MKLNLLYFVLFSNFPAAIVHLLQLMTLFQKLQNRETFVTLPSPQTPSHTNFSYYVKLWKAATPCPMSRTIQIIHQESQREKNIFQRVPEKSYSYESNPSILYRANLSRSGCFAVSISGRHIDRGVYTSDTKTIKCTINMFPWQSNVFELEWRFVARVFTVPWGQLPRIKN